MTTERKQIVESKTRTALTELQGVLRDHYPNASFAVRRGIDDAEAVQLWATVDVEDTDEVLDHVIDRVLELQLEGLPVHVIAVRPRERVIAMRREEHARAALGPSV